MRKHKIMISLILLFCFAVSFQSCEKKEVQVMEQITYDAAIAPIMNNYCITCHSGSLPSANLSLDNYSAVRSIAETGKLFGRMNDTDNPMPPSGLLSESDRQKIATWIENGFEE